MKINFHAVENLFSRLEKGEIISPRIYKKAIIELVQLYI